jgi:hypothetical protein
MPSNAVPPEVVTAAAYVVLGNLLLASAMFAAYAARTFRAWMKSDR